jgi:hypothetical protein
MQPRNSGDASRTGYQIRRVARFGRIATSVNVRVQATVVAIVIVDANGPCLTVPGRVGATTILGRRHTERGKQQQ